MLASNQSPFDVTTGELLPTFRDAYLRGELPAEQSQAVEQYLRTDAVQRGVALARYHQLAAAHSGAALQPPAWVRQQLARQASVSAIGPLRRPVVRLALGVLVVLSGTATVQWIRQEPLVPEPVVQSIQYAAKSVQQVTDKIVALTPLAADSTDEQEQVEAKTRTAQWRKAKLLAQRPKAKSAVAEPVRSSEITAVINPAQPRQVNLELPTSNEATTNANVLPVTEAAAPAADPANAPRTVVTGSVRDQHGKPLAGATVFVKGTQQGTSTDAKGNYRLEIPAGATLQFGYAGYVDKYIQGEADALNVSLEPESSERRSALRKASRANQL
jgi:hypothetical protein